MTVFSRCPEITVFWKDIIQFVRFSFVGIVSNGMLYLLYLLLTHKGIDPKGAMTVAFMVGVLQTFIFNKKWAFSHEGSTSKSFVRYVLVYVFLYVFSLVVLIVFVDIANFPHQIVQGIITLLCGLLSFALQKKWVFRLPVLDNQ